MSFNIGTDPEFAIFDARGKFVPAWKLFPGVDDKLQLGRRGDSYSDFDGLTIHHDGAMAEFNTPFEYCREGLASYMRMGFKEALRRMPPGYKFRSMPTVEIDQVDIDEAPPDCQVFGCDAAHNAYTDESTGVSLDASTHRWRYGGGHMHISRPQRYAIHDWINDHESCLLFVKMLDLYVGLALTVWFAKPETFMRRKYYGKAGEFRFQRYGHDSFGEPLHIGVEYRTPGPEVWNDTVVASWAFGTMRTIADYFPMYRKGWDAGMEPDVRHAINTGEGAVALLRHLPEFTNQRRFERTIKFDRPFQELVVTDDSSTRGWNWYHERGPGARAA